MTQQHSAYAESLKVAIAKAIADHPEVEITTIKDAFETLDNYAEDGGPETATGIIEIALEFITRDIDWFNLNVKPKDLKNP